MEGPTHLHEKLLISRLFIISVPDKTGVYAPHQRFLLLIVALVVLGALALFGMLQYLTASLGAGILHVVFRPGCTGAAAGTAPS